MKEAILCFKSGEDWITTVTGLYEDLALWQHPTMHCEKEKCASLMMSQVFSLGKDRSMFFFASCSFQVFSSSCNLLFKTWWYNSRNLERCLWQTDCNFFALCPFELRLWCYVTVKQCDGELLPNSRITTVYPPSAVCALALAASSLCFTWIPPRVCVTSGLVCLGGPCHRMLNLLLPQREFSWVS